jgi:Domain of unknown function (DUF1937)
MIYLASPYTSPDPKIVEQRYDQTVLVMSQLLRQGVKIYSPIVHCHVISTRHNLPTDYKFWLDYNTHMLELCYGMFILCLDGWKDSLGIKDEIKIAQRLKIPIDHIDFNGQSLRNKLL